MKHDLVGIELDLDDLVDKGPFILSGINTATHMVRIGNVVIEAIEDENDGYRSMLDHCLTRDPNYLGPNIAPVEVIVKSHHMVGDYEFDGWIFEHDGLEILRIGTENNDGYYPSFTFSYTPLGVAQERQL